MEMRTVHSATAVGSAVIYDDAVTTISNDKAEKAWALVLCTTQNSEASLWL